MTPTDDDRPWAGLPVETIDSLRPQLPMLADDIVEAIADEVPEYARPLEGPFGDGLRRGVEIALQRFLDLMHNPEAGPAAAGGREVYVGLGRGELRAGRRLDALLAAYRVGARVAWRRLAAAGEHAGVEPQALYQLAESIFAYIDEISSESVEGYAMEQAAEAGALQRRRRRLAALLVQDPAADRVAVEAAAAEADWRLPETLAPIVADGDDPDRFALRLGADVIATRVGTGVCALVPDPDAPGRRAQLAAALEGKPAALGVTGPWERVAVQARRARSTLDLESEGALRATGDITLVADHTLELLLHADRGLATDIGVLALAPLAEETEASRRRLTETLRAWLGAQGRTEQIAATLHVHPQTVRYRMARLRERFGERLDDPDGRFELELALRVDGRD